MWYFGENLYFCILSRKSRIFLNKSRCAHEPIEHLLAKRLLDTNSGSFTKVIIRIAYFCIAVSLTVMILFTTSIISGFKREITDKIFGFEGHIHITDSNINRNFELTIIRMKNTSVTSRRLSKQIEYQADAKMMGMTIHGKVSDKITNGGVKGVHPYMYFPDS